MAQLKPAPLVWINGFPGTGKFTIASILAHKSMEGWCTLVHNHDLIDAVTCPRDHPDYRRLRKDERSKAFARHVLAADTLEKCVVCQVCENNNELFELADVLTVPLDSQPKNDIDAEIASEYRNAAIAAGRPFLPFYLSVSTEENVRRVAMPSRLASGARKLVDTELLLAMRDSCELFEFGDIDGLHLDVTNIDAEESARKIFDFIRWTTLRVG
jgi:hypothetical protein